MTKKHVLFVEDDAFFARPYREALEEVFDVTFISDAGDAVYAIKNRKDLSALVLDVMMPTPKGIASTATDAGFETGIWILRETRSQIMDCRIPVVVISNRSVAVVQRAVTRIDFNPRELVVVRQKVETLAPQLVKIVSSQISVYG